MLQFFRDRRPALFLVAVLALLFTLMAAQVRGGTATAESLVLRGMSPVLRLATAATTGVSEIWYGYVDLRGLRDRNHDLESELTRMTIRLNALEEAALQNDRLRSLLDLKEAIAHPSVAATVIGNKSLGLSRTILVDRGSDHGVAQNMPVISVEGVVGRVWTVSPRISKVQLITDADAGTAVLVQRTRVQGILQGRGADLCSMEYVSMHDDVAEGDLIVTNGLDGIYPRGLPVGPVIQVAPGQGTLRAITVEPRVGFNRLEEVLILQVPPGGVEIPDPVEGTP